MNEQDKEAFENFWVDLENERGHQRSPSNANARRAWQAALEYRDNHTRKFADMELLLCDEQKRSHKLEIELEAERARSLKLVCALEVVESGHTGDQHHWDVAREALASYRASEGDA